MSRKGAKAAEPDTVEDGRFQRSVRSRERIIDALTELISGGNLQPTGQQIATRAGIALRTVFRHFDDMEGLYREMHSRIQGIVQPLAGEPLVEGAMRDRVHALVRRRVVIFERVAPFLRSSAVLRWKSIYLRETQARDVRIFRSQLEQELPEIASLPAARQEAIHLLTSFEAWDRLRTDQRVGRERAQAVVVDSILALLAS